MGHKLLMISGDRTLAEGKRGAFYNTLEEFHKYWDRIDIITPRLAKKQEIHNIFGNVVIHASPWPIFCQPFWILKKGKRIFDEQKFDLTTVHEYPPFYNGIGAMWLHAKIGVPYVLEIMHIPGYPRTTDLKEKIYKQSVKTFIKYDAKKAAKVRVINRRQTPEFLRSAGVPAEKLLYIPAFYIDLDIFKPIDTPKRYDLVFAARLEKNKGIFELIKAIKIAKTKNPAIKLLIIGGGPLKEKLKMFVCENNLEGNVFFSGWLETAQDVARAYNSARIFINPSFNEGGPRVVLEAMACGLPIITTRVGLMMDLVRDNENGLFVSWEPKDMADKIINLLGNEDLQKKSSRAGLEIIKQFKKSAAIKNFADKLRALI